MFGSFRAGGFAAATLLLSATFMGAGQSQVLDSSTASSAPTPSFAAPASSPTPTLAASNAPAAFVEPAQIVLPVQSAPSSFPEPAVPVPDFTAPVAPVAVAPVPVVRKNASLAELVAAHRSSAVADREQECLAGAIYFESKGEPLSGQVAVGQVIANRAKSGRFPGSYCGVVFQRSQFSFVRGRALPPIPRSSAHWKTAVAVAHIVTNDMTHAVAPKALFFHARHVSPNWKRMSRVATVGNHIFYR